MTEDASANGAPDAGAPVQFDDDVLEFAHLLFDLARDGDAVRLGEYLDAGVPPNLTNDKGDTLLILAAYRGHADAVRVLVEHGADVTRSNDRGQTALAAGVFKQSEPVVATLLAAGANPADGSPSAVETARFFDLPAMLALLQPGS